MKEKKLVVFLIEDDEVDYINVQKSIDKIEANVELIHAWDGEEAKQMIVGGVLGSGPFVILLDLNMPKMNGYEFLKWLREESPEPYRNIVVTILTTSASQEDKEKTYSLYVGGYIVKPLEIDKYIEAATNFVDYWTMCELPEIKRR